MICECKTCVNYISEVTFIPYLCALPSSTRAQLVKVNHTMLGKILHYDKYTPTRFINSMIIDI